jgi:hypothetical protein
MWDSNISILTLVYSTISHHVWVHHYISTLPLKQSFFFFFNQFYGPSPISLVGLCGFARTTHIYLYFMDSRLCPCHEPLLFTLETIVGRSYTLHLYSYSKNSCTSPCYKPLLITLKILRPYLHIAPCICLIIYFICPMKTIYACVSYCNCSFVLNFFSVCKNLPENF